MRQKYVVFVIQGYDIDTEEEKLVNICSFEIIANNAEEALARAKQLQEKEYYKVSSVIERYFYDTK